MRAEHEPDEIERRLSELEAESDRRRAELASVIGDLPAAVSRRALVIAGARDLRAAPDKGSIVVRGARKIGRIPGAIGRRLRALLAR